MRHTTVRNLSRSLLISLSAGALLAAACGGTNAPAPQMAAASVTPELGGTVTLPDNSAKLEVPAGAVGEATMITVSTTTMSAPAGTTALSPVLKFEPDGLVFTKPVRVTFNFKSGATSPSVYWSNAAGGYDALGGMVDGSTIAADVTHFSSGFVGEGSPCTEGATCGAGSKCGVGTGGGTNGGSSGGTGTMTGGVDASAPMSDPGTGSGGSNSGGTSPPRTSALTSDGMCCACGDDGKYHCGACAVPGADAGVPMCAEGVACTPGSGCASGGGGSTATSNGGSTAGTGPTTSGGTCCSCGADGLFHCGATCSGGIDTGTDGGRTGGGGSNGGGGVNAGTDPGNCAPGAACQPGTGCGGGSAAGACIKCMCGTDGTLACTDCTSPPPADAGAPPPPPPTCQPGAACQPGSGCGGGSATGACIKCMCGTDGTLACTDCTSPPPADAGAPPPPPPTCQPGAACQPGSACGGGGSPDAACIKCMCGTDGTLVCSDCGAPPPADAGAPPPPPPQCVPQTDCPVVGAACNAPSPDGGCMMCVCGGDHLVACKPCG